MEGQYTYTALSDDTVALESESCGIDTNTEVVDVCKSFQHTGDQMEDYCEKEVVLDSDDEGGEQNKPMGMVNREHLHTVQGFSSRDATCSRKRQRTPVGYFRRVGNKVNAYMLIHRDSARSSGWAEESTAGRTCLDNGSRDHDVTVGCLPSRSPDQKKIPTNAKKTYMDEDCRDMLSKSMTRDSLDEKVSFSYGEDMNIEKDANYCFEHEKLSYVETPESQGKALDFVDHYISISDLGSSKDVEGKKAYRIKSPPSLMSKGAQSLASRVNLGFGSKSLTFDWTEQQTENTVYTYARKSKDSTFGFKGDKSGYIFACRKSDTVNVPKEKISSLQSKEKLSRNKLTPNDLDINPRHSNEIDEVGSNPLNCEQLDAGSSGQNVGKDELMVTEDALGVGMDTQMAAEAMEALIYAVPPIFDACFTHQGSGNIFGEGSSNGVNKSISKQFTIPQESFIGWTKKDKRSKCVKVSTVKLTKEVSYSAAEQNENQIGTDARSPVSKNLITEKLLSAKEINCRNPGITKNSKCGRLPRSTVKERKDRFAEIDSWREIQNDHCLAQPIGCKLNGRLSIEGDSKIKPSIPLKRRRLIKFNNDGGKGGVSGKCLKSNSHSSSQVAIDKEKGEESHNLYAANSGLSKLNVWICPKGKRTSHQVTCHSNGLSNQGSPCVEIYSAGKCPPVKEETHKRAAKLLVYTRRRQFSSERKNLATSFKLTSNNNSPSTNDNEFPDRQVLSASETDAAKPSKRNCELEDGLFPSSGDTSDHLKLADLSNGSSNILQVCVGSDKSKQPFNPMFTVTHKRVPKLLVYTRRRQFSSERKHLATSFKLTSNKNSPSINDNEFSDIQVLIPSELDTAKPSKRFCKLEDRQFPTSVDTSDHVKLADLSNGNPKILQVCAGSDKSEQPFNPMLRSPLMKELTRLGYTKSLPDFLPKDSRRRTTGKVCVLFSQNLEPNILKQQRKIVSRLGFSIASCCTDATHFVTDRFVRTRNMFVAIARGIPVVTHLWLESCEHAGCVIDEKSYILRDEKREKLIGFSMPLSLTRARQYPLLEGHKVFITPNVKPGVDVIHCLVKAVHGQVVQNLQSLRTTNKAIPDDLLILSCEEDYTFCVSFLEKGASVYSSEILLNGIIIQKLEYDRHQLFKDFS